MCEQEHERERERASEEVSEGGMLNIRKSEKKIRLGM
jgi:hypothetical protein